MTLDEEGYRVSTQDMRDMKLFAEFLGKTMKPRRKRRSGPNPDMPETSSVRVAMRFFCNGWEWKTRQNIPEDIKYSMAFVGSAPPIF